MMWKDFEQFESMFPVIGSFLQPTLVVAGDSFRTPDFDEDIADAEITSAFLIPRQVRVNLVRDTVLKQPFIDSVLPTRLDQMPIRALVPLAESRSPYLGSGGSNFFHDSHRGYAITESKFCGGHAAFIKLFGFLNRYMNIIMMSGTSVVTFFNFSETFRRSQICTSWGASLDAGTFKGNRYRCLRDTISLGNVLQSITRFIFPPNLFIWRKDTPARWFASAPQAITFFGTESNTLSDAIRMYLECLAAHFTSYIKFTIRSWHDQHLHYPIWKFSTGIA